MITTISFHPAKLAVAISAVLLLAACEETSIQPIEHDEDHDHADDHEHEDSATGRLIFMEYGEDATRAFVYDLEANELLESFDLQSPGRLLASPDYRYAVAIQRDAGVTRFVDSGYETEPHGDHAHYNELAPALSGFTLAGERPTHYDFYHHRGALFYDGAEGIASKIEVFSDQSIVEEQVLAELELSSSMHGAAEIREDYLFTANRSDATATGLPDSVEVYERHSDHFDFVQGFENECVDLHGSALNEQHVAFGCGDGVLLLSEAEDGSFVSEKLSMPETLGGRVGSLWGHEESPYFIGSAGQNMVLIDTSTGESWQLDWKVDEAREFGSVAFNYTGDRFAVLDTAGDMTIFRLREQGHESYPFELQSQFTVVSDTHEMALAMTVNQVNHQAYIADPGHQRITVVDLHDGEVVEQRDLDVEPGSLIWTGFTSEESHDH
ncbi:hypothetical protein CWE12_00180 [Aliidiomarina sedimenti]|uniref:5-methyltetrahydrofolate--homocysteine methyltransferase n=1 Tax=Aliidiomarina sedimenti TaxID=1933879 RepID=A0ABY0C110_9GAMM|nr:hypothetical protein [Aliidiomarina sedimenti]RUO31458.1 hypothetical protein CWE12_00180 [Aliidiomarina sedimenti]